MTAPFAFAFISATSLLTVVNPISAAPLFVALTANVDERRRRRIAREASAATFLVLLLFGAAGTLVFRFFGITPAAFRIAGGLLFLLMSMGSLLGRREITPEDEAAADPSLVPIAIPMLAGPGAITTAVVLGAQATTSQGKGLVGLATLLVAVCTWAVLHASPWLVARVRPEPRKAVEKLLALLTGVIGVQFVIDGAREVAIEILRAVS